jgi:ubiquinone/menaquinone biosynthesis C-methylase UbiE
MSQCSNRNNIEHQHGGKSSESRLDKKLILDSLDLSAGQTVLDAGCGNGYMAKEFAEIVTDTGKVFALDPHEESIDALKKESKGTDIEPFVGDITAATKLEDSSIDLIYISVVLHGFSDSQIASFSKEAKRLLKPGGKLAILENKKEEAPFGPPLEIKISPEELKQAIDLTPDKLVEITQHFYLQIFRCKC